MFLGMQDFDFYPNRVKFYPILFKFIQICPNLTKNFLYERRSHPQILRHWE